LAPVGSSSEERGRGCLSRRRREPRLQMRRRGFCFLGVMWRRQAEMKATTDRFEQATGEEAQAADETLSAQMVGAYN